MMLTKVLLMEVWDQAICFLEIQHLMSKETKKRLDIESIGLCTALKRGVFNYVRTHPNEGIVYDDLKAEVLGQFYQWYPTEKNRWSTWYHHKDFNKKPRDANIIGWWWLPESQERITYAYNILDCLDNDII